MDSNVYTILYDRTGQHEIQENSGFQLLSTYLDDLEKRLLRTDCRQEDEDIREAVTEMVWNILRGIKEVDPYFAVSKLESVGSIAEGTKLGKPDEFDFVALMQCFDESKYSVKVINECGNSGTAHIRCSTSSNLPVEILDDEEEHLHNIENSSLRYVSPVKFRIRFWNLFTSVAVHISKNKQRISKPMGYLTLVEEVAQHLDMFVKGPNVEIEMIWTSASSGERHGICVDVTPALKVFSDSIPFVGLNYHLLENALVNAGKDFKDIFLIPAVNMDCKLGGHSDPFKKLCWRLSLSTIETEMIRSMDSAHKKCFRILKFLKSNQRDALDNMKQLGLNITADRFSSVVIRMYHEETHVLTTYMLKAVLLHHNLRCIDESKNIAKCMMEMLSFLNDCIDKRLLTSYFLKDKNLWSQGGSALPVFLLKPSIEKLLGMFTEVIVKKQISFQNFSDKFQDIQSYLTENDGI